MVVDGKNENVITLIMAAGKGTRMKSDMSKLVHKIYGKELVKRVVDLANDVGSDETIAIVGYLKEQVQNVLGDSVKYAYQEELLGTGHAVMQANEYLEGKTGKVVILYGDVPLIRKETIQKLISKSFENKEYATVLTSFVENPKGYGRIIRDEGGSIKAIIEEKDANIEQKKIKEVNSGIYCFDIPELVKALKKIDNNNAQGEYYLTDVIKIMNENGLKTGAVTVEDKDEVLGANDRVQLEALTTILKNRINTQHMKNGVTLIDSNNTYIFDDVKIGKDTVIYPNTVICDGAVIGNKCDIGLGCYIGQNVTIQDNSFIDACTVLKNNF